MKMKKITSSKLIVWMLSLILVLSVAYTPMTAGAQESVDEGIKDYNEEYYDSYEEAVEASQAETGQADVAGISDSGNSINATAGATTYNTVASAAKYVREQMVARQTTILFNFKNSEGYSYEAAYFAIKDEIFKETGVYNQGAYLKWNWAGTKVYYAVESDGSITYKLTVSYLSTAYQEKQIDTEVSRLLSNEFAGWQNMHNYEKVKMVYAWMTSTYSYVEGTNNHSTYSGMINHKTVCQGYATSMYRLLGEMGVNTRVIANDTHGWNIVQLGRYWYSLDATWDTGYSEAYWDFFLPDEYTFTYLYNHVRGSEYDTAEFHEEHPMAGTAYDYATERNNVGVDYRTHVQDYGWQNFVYDGVISGTTGESKRLEGIEIKLGNTGSYDLGVTYRTHIQNKGWESTWKSNGAMSGTSGQSLRLEAIQIKLTGADAGKFDIWYRVHAQNYGWLGWAKNGQEAGTASQSLRLEGIQILVLPKGEAPDGLLGYSYVDLGTNSSSTNTKAGLVNYRTHVQDYGWQGYVYDGSKSGTSGLSKRLEGINISLGDTGYSGGIRYQTHVQNKGWENVWKLDGEMSGTSGQSLRLEGIRIELYGDVAEHYDVYYRVHAQDYGWLDWAKNGAEAGTAGLSKRLEAIQIVVLPKGSTAPGSTTRPFVSK